MSDWLRGKVVLLDPKKGSERNNLGVLFNQQVMRLANTLGTLKAPQFIGEDVAFGHDSNALMVTSIGGFADRIMPSS